MAKVARASTSAVDTIAAGSLAATRGGYHTWERLVVTARLASLAEVAEEALFTQAQGVHGVREGALALPITVHTLIANAMSAAEPRRVSLALLAALTAVEPQVAVFTLRGRGPEAGGGVGVTGAESCAIHAVGADTVTKALVAVAARAFKPAFGSVEA